MRGNRRLDGDEDLISWEVLTSGEQAKVFSMFLFILLLGVAIGVGLAKAGVV